MLPVLRKDGDAPVTGRVARDRCAACARVGFLARAACARVGFLAIAIALTLVLAPAALAANPIQAENALPGDSYWTAATHDPVSANPPIDGYASANSVRAGETISFQVTTNPVAHYRVEISRLGWYGGKGGRRITCLVGAQLDPTCSRDHLGVQQPSPAPPDPVTGEIRAGWSLTDTLTVPSNWPSGYYLAVFRLTSGPSSGVTGFAPFIVQAPVGDQSAILVQVPANTWQAYNAWGGQSLYTNPRAVKVSFDRPYAHRLLFDWEYPLVRFLERGGWDVSYATDDDVDADPSILLDHFLDMDAGHDEYWTKNMRDGWEAARNAGVNLAFMGANDSFWQVRYEDNRRTMVGYKYSADPDPDPAQKTTEFRWLTPPRPECELFGIEFQNVVLINRNIDATADPAVATDPWFAGSGLTPGSVLSGLGGGETDEITTGCHVPPVTPLLSYAGPPANGTPSHGDAVRYTACSGAEVLSGGSLQFSWGLDSWRDPGYTGPGLVPVPPASPGLQRAMTNALADLTRSHVPVPGPPHICVPTPAISVPMSWAAVGQPVSFQSAAADQYGSISTQQWSVSFNGSSRTAAGPSVTRTFWRPGTVSASLTVADSSGPSATTTKALPVCQCPAPGHGTIRYPPGAQTGPPCELMGLGTLQPLGRGLAFSANASFRRVTITTYRILVGHRQIRLARLSVSPVARASGPVAVTQIHASMLIDVAAHAAGRVWHERFVVPYESRRSGGQPGVVSAAMCDGTSGQLLDPVFRGPRSLPLQVAVSGPGRVTVSLSKVGGGPAERVAVISRGKTVIVTLPQTHITRGVYRVTVTASRSHLRQPVRLTALAV